MPGGGRSWAPGRSTSSEAIKQDGDALTRKMAERLENRKAMRGLTASKRASPAAVPTKDNAVRTFSTLLHGCLTTQGLGFTVNADSVITAVLQNSPASAP